MNKTILILAALMAFVIIVAFAVTDTPQNLKSKDFELSEYKAGDAAYQEEFGISRLPGNDGYLFSDKGIMKLGLEYYSKKNFVWSPFAKIREPTTDQHLEFYQLPVKGSLYLCPKNYSDTRGIKTIDCKNTGATYYDAILLKDADGSVYTVTLDNYKTGKTADVYLNGQKISDAPFELNDRFNDAVAGCVTISKKNKKVCVLLDGDEQKYVSIDLDRLWVTIQPQAATPIPQPQQITCSTIAQCLAQIDLKLVSDLKLAK